MTEYQRAKRIGELRMNLLLWDTPGFSRVINDLAGYIGGVIPVEQHLKALKNTYKRELTELEDNIDPKFKQGKLDL